MISYFTRYGPNYLRTITYMLQASEYHYDEYFEWLARTREFRDVSKRRSLVLTAKARLILQTLWIMMFLGGVLILTSVIIFIAYGNLIWILLGVTLIIVWPWVLSHGIIIPLSLGIYLIQRPYENFIIKQAGKKLLQHPAQKVAIAGSFGKTTFKENLKTILSAGRKVAATPGNRNTPIGISWFAQSLSGDEEVLIFELGEYYPGDIRGLCELVRPDLGIITGINEAHLSKFKSIDKTADTVFELADYLANKPVYRNGESSLIRERVSLVDPLVYSKLGVNGWRISGAATGLFGLAFTAIKGKKKIQARSRLLGLHHLGPLIACIDIADRCGLSVKQIEEGVGKTKPFDHRLQPVKSIEGVVTIDDTYNGNPDGAKAAIDFLAGIKGRRRFYVTPGLVEMGQRSAGIHRQLGRALAKSGVEYVVLIKTSVTPFIEEGLKEGGFTGNISKYPDVIACHEALPQIAKDGDVVLLQNDWPDNYI